MSYYEVWKKKLISQGNNESESRFNFSKDLISREFKNDPSYRKALLKKLDLTEKEIDIRIKNVDRTTSEKRIIFLPDTKIEVGCCIEYGNRNYLITEFQDENVLSPYAVAKFCNQTIKFENNIEIPAVVEGESYGVKIFQGNNEFNTAIDTKVNMTVGDKPLNRKIFKPNTRIMFGNSEYGIYKIGDLTYYKKGLIVCTCKKDKFLNGLDDLENGICWQEKEEINTNDDLSYLIVGNDEIRVGEASTYSIEPKNGKAEFIIADYLINDGIIQYEKVDDYSIKIKALKPNELIKIKCKINETEATKNVLTVR